MPRGEELLNSSATSELKVGATDMDWSRVTECLCQRDLIVVQCLRKWVEYNKARVQFSLRIVSPQSTRLGTGSSRRLLHRRQSPIACHAK